MTVSPSPSPTRTAPGTLYRLPATGACAISVDKAILPILSPKPAEAAANKLNMSLSQWGEEINDCMLSESGESWGPSAFKAASDDKVFGGFQTSFLPLATESTA